MAEAPGGVHVPVSIHGYPIALIGVGAAELFGPDQVPGAIQLPHKRIVEEACGGQVEGVYRIRVEIRSLTLSVNWCAGIRGGGSSTAIWSRTELHWRFAKRPFLSCGS